MNGPSRTETGLVDALSPELQRRLMTVLERYLAELEQGSPPDPDQLVAEHPELAAPLKAYLDSLDFLHQAAAGFDSSPRTESAQSASTSSLPGRASR